MSGFGGREMAVDLGTANTLVCVRARNRPVRRTSMVADQHTGEVHAVGIEAKRMLGRTPGTISAIEPLKDDVIADFDVLEQMLRHFIQKVHHNRSTRASLSASRAASPAWRNARRRGGDPVRRRPPAYLIEEPMAAAIPVPTSPSPSPPGT